MTENNVRFRGIRALYGLDGFDKLQKAHVLVIGVGGIGSWLTEALCRSGVGRLTLIDPDVIEIGNSNRQLHTTSKTLGQNKAKTLAARLKEINPNLEVDTIDTYLTTDNVEATLQNAPHFVCEAIDDIAAKACVVNFLKHSGRIFISAGGAGGRIDPSRLKITDIAEAKGDALIARLRTELRRKYNFPKNGKKMGVFCTYSDEKPTYSAKILQLNEGLPVFGASMAVTASAGLLLASYMLKKIVEEA
ncbi:tRNA threonylcarbamoyladenosine dehydratase [Anaerobiospirillum thomasii]|uniref:Molybdopterin-synthase adenylyltransferase n=1 Tax=Anaerobiospirillum thomasii TaxID=179995 RepID=A0A2X0WRN9_9GAMM|nr:tRNA threonylcarbamoyladenosine dehydratase [Anaerobiospirillum thomasii]SPT69242.1 Molybdopterin-synthase adenylyltransferase [Anaerobiospirillum thomasii]